MYYLVAEGSREYHGKPFLERYEIHSAERPPAKGIPLRGTTVDEAFEDFKNSGNREETCFLRKSQNDYEKDSVFVFAMPVVLRNTLDEARMRSIETGGPVIVSEPLINPEDKKEVLSNGRYIHAEDTLVQSYEGPCWHFPFGEICFVERDAKRVMRLLRNKELGVKRKVKKVFTASNAYDLYRKMQTRLLNYSRLKKLDNETVTRGLRYIPTCYDVRGDAPDIIRFLCKRRQFSRGWLKGWKKSHFIRMLGTKHSRTAQLLIKLARGRLTEKEQARANKLLEKYNSKPYH